MKIKTENILIIGCGGIGSYLIREVENLSRQGQINSDITISDFDIVELKNIKYQNFKNSDIGKEKAVVLGDRYLFNSVRKIKNEDDLEEMTGSGGVGGFGTPFAFATKEPMSSKGKKKVNEAFEALIVEFRGVTPPQYRRFLKKHGLKMVRANAEASTSTSHIVGDLWTQEPTNVNVIVSHLGKWKAGHGGDVQYGSGLANLKSRLSKYMSIRDGVNEEFNALMEGGDPYYGWRNDETQTPKQKIGRAISEINKQLREVEKVVKRTQRLKKESGTANGTLWKRTNNSLMKIESRMHRISQTIRNMRG
ncbi:hypothetical protein LCGC14_2399550 [marine sediment metagenome]|uniref:THIF-type NAD/FAD binding fold domain-containing protein n=1 Tax=marine sediment metagenome TaxID=412755 RepID=A0A0F9E834_9ZZZZ